jgi:hypothetical protein
MACFGGNCGREKRTEWQESWKMYIRGSTYGKVKSWRFKRYLELFCDIPTYQCLSNCRSSSHLKRPFGCRIRLQETYKGIRQEKKTSMRLILPLLSPLLLCASTSASASPDSETPSSTPDEPTPVGALWTAKWNATTLAPFTQHCHSKASYEAKIYKLDQLYPDLAEQAPQLKVFYNKQLYAGSWDGVDVHGVGRELMVMHMADLPYKVREWLKKESLQRHYSVQDDLVFFAPGAIYPLLPLWVDDVEEDQGAECAGVFDGLDRYRNEPEDGKVIGKIQHEKVGDKEVRFTVEALLVKAKEARDEL